ncbi:MAG: hypothetical protein ABJE10_23730 [bacterium]
MLLTFTDQSGITWDVFEVHLSDRRTVSRVPPTFQRGWLCFQSVDERRRLAPIPDGWQHWDVETLTAALLATHGMPRRTPRHSFEAATLPEPTTSGEHHAMA